MKSRFLDGLSANERDQVKYEFEKAHEFRKKLTEILEKDIESLVTSMTKEESLESVNWVYLQADRVAQIKAYKKIVGLLK